MEVILHEYSQSIEIKESNVLGMYQLCPNLASTKDEVMMNKQKRGIFIFYIYITKDCKTSISEV